MQRPSPRQIALRQFRRVEDGWSHVRDGDATAVHDARVAVRRIRAALPFLGAPNADAARTFRTLGRRLGKVRELDVTYDLLADLERRLPRLGPFAAIIRQNVCRARDNQRRRLLKALDRVSLTSLRRQLVARGQGLAAVQRLWYDWRGSLRAAIGERAMAVEHAVDRASGIYIAPRLHDARIAIKKLRYTTELGIATGIVKDPDLVRPMKDAQDVLGLLHDLQVLSKELRQSERSGGSEVDSEVMTSIVEMDLAALHAKYLRRRTRILEACVACHAIASETHALRTVGRATMYALPIVGAGVRGALLWRQVRVPMHKPVEVVPHHVVSAGDVGVAVSPR